jgi:hypothetical protein
MAVKIDLRQDLIDERGTVTGHAVRHNHLAAGIPFVGDFVQLGSVGPHPVTQVIHRLVSLGDPIPVIVVRVPSSAVDRDALSHEGWEFSS